MSWWKFWSDEEDEAASPDYYEEGVRLAREEKYHEALTSFRLALRESPENVAALEQMAVVYTRIGMTDEAIKTYRRALEADVESPGSHYGVAYLYLDRGQEAAACRHLEAFLGNPPDEPEANEHVRHARETLEELRQEQEGGTGEGPAHDAPSGGGRDRG